MEKTLKEIKEDLTSLDKKMALHIQRSDIHMESMSKFRETVSEKLNPVYLEFIFQQRLKKKRIRDLKIYAMWLGIPAGLGSIIYTILQIAQN